MEKTEDTTIEFDFEVRNAELQKLMDGYSGDLLRDAARLQRLKTLDTPWTAESRPDKTLLERTCHNGRLNARKVNRLADNIARQQVECSCYIQAAIDGCDQKKVADYFVALDEDRAKDPKRKGSIPDRSKTKRTSRMALDMQVRAMWVEAGCPRGLTPEILKVVEDWKAKRKEV